MDTLFHVEIDKREFYSTFGIVFGFQEVIRGWSGEGPRDLSDAALKKRASGLSHAMQNRLGAVNNGVPAPALK